MNIGHSSRMIYDDDYYSDRVNESTGPMNYRLSPDQMYNCNSCLSTMGPRSSGFGRGYDVSRDFATGYAASQDLVDVESNLSNRGLPSTKSRKGRVNFTNVNDRKMKHVRLCDDTMNPEASRLSMPASNYRGTSINRFYNLPRDPQANIFWDGAVNTRLEATDNFKPDVPTPWADMAQPPVQRSQYTTCETSCKTNGKKVKCPTSWGPQKI
jgi:hypothetical protein